MKEQDRREWNQNGDGPLRDGTSFKCLSYRGCCPPPRCTSTTWKNLRANDVPDHTVSASSTSSPLIFLLVSISSVFVQAVGLRTYGSKHSLLACRSSFAHSHLLTLAPGWQELSLGWAEPEGGNPLARRLRFSRRQVSVTPRQQAGVNRENRWMRVRVWPLLWFLCQHHMCACATQLYSVWSDLYGIFLLITMIVIRLFSSVAPMSTELKYTFSKCQLFLLIATCGLILCPYSSFSNSTFTSDSTANLLLSKSVHGTVFSFVHLSLCFGRITQYCQ